MPSLAELLARDCVVQMESTIPAELTIAEWRRRRLEPVAPRSLRAPLLRVARLRRR